MTKFQSCQLTPKSAAEKGQTRQPKKKKNRVKKKDLCEAYISLALLFDPPKQKNIEIDIFKICFFFQYMEIFVFFSLVYGFQICFAQLSTIGSINGTVFTFAFDNINNITYVGGGGGNLASSSLPVVAINSSGTFELGSGATFSGQLNTMIVDSGQNLIVGSQSSAPYCWNWSSRNTTWHNYTTFTGGGIFDFTQDKNNVTYAAGAFSGNLAQLDSAKKSWTIVTNPLHGTIHATVFNLATNEMYLAGEFQPDQQMQHIAKWDGSNWFPLGNGTDSTINDIVIDPTSGNVFAGGYFLKAGSVSASYIAVYNGQSWQPLQNGTNSFVYSLAYHNPSGALFVGGGIHNSRKSYERRIFGRVGQFHVATHARCRWRRQHCSNQLQHFVHWR